MSVEYLLPNEDLGQLFCYSCGNYLSILPVYLKNDNSAAICGRCIPINKDDFIRDEPYEAIAEFLQFPCCYEKNGCQEQLKPQSLQKHELVCLFRKFECPTKIYTGCKWLGVRSDLVKHFEENHPHLLYNREFQWSFDISHRENLLFPFKDEFFIVKKEIDVRKQTFSCSVQRFAAETNSKHYYYIIKLLSHNRGFWCTLPQKNTESEENVIVSGDFIKQNLNDPPSVFLQIQIVEADKTKTDDPLQKSVEVEGNPDLNWEILGQLKCPVCDDIMCPPIYQCTDGHSFCSECKPNIKECPLCRIHIKDTRNFILEKLTPFMTYPCKFYKSGCKYTSKSLDIKKHQEICEFGPHECPLKNIEMCQVMMYQSEIVNHVEEKHSSFIVKSNRITVPFELDEARQFVYLLKYSNSIFVARYMYMNRKFYWTVQLVGPSEECRKFKFDIDIVDNSKSKLRCYIKGFCISIQDNINFENPRTYVMLTYEQLQNLITTTLDYNIHILKD